MTLNIDLSHLKTVWKQGHISRQELLEEVERHLDRTSEGPVPGALDIILEELHASPWDPHLLRLLARLYKRDGDAKGAEQALKMAQQVHDSNAEPNPREREHEVLKFFEQRLTLARAYLGCDLTEAAEEVAAEAVAQEPTSLSAINLLAKICHIQGRLSDTIRLWRKVQQLNPNREGAQTQLDLLYRLTANDEMGGLPFASVGVDVYAPKHEVQIEIERAFRAFQQRDFQAAVDICDDLAESQRIESPPLYKLAVLQKAWIQERTGSLLDARATLEQLGRERGFEMDLDRLSMLARICEKLGTLQSRQMAVHIYEHLNIRHGKMSALPRLSVLYGCLSETETQKLFDKEYERRFAQRMHKTRPVDYLRAMTIRYIPFDQIKSLTFDDKDIAACGLEISIARSDTEGERMEALMALLRGEKDLARERLTTVCERLSAGYFDFAHLADLEAHRDTSIAWRLYAIALERAGACDPVLWKRALLWAREQGLTDNKTKLPLEINEDVLDFLKEHARSEPARPDRWEILSIYERIAGREQESRGTLRKTQALRDAMRDRPSDIGRVLLAAVFSLGNKPKGIIHEVIASRRPAAGGYNGDLTDGDIHGNLAPDLRALIRTVFAATRDYARARWPHLCVDIDRYAYSIRVTKEDEPSSGNSAGLPIAVAFLSVFLELPIPQNLTMTGAVVGDSRDHVSIHRVGDAIYKVKGAIHRNLDKIILPSDNRPDVELGDVVPPAASSKITSYAATLDDAVELIWGRTAWDL